MYRKIIAGTHKKLAAEQLEHKNFKLETFATESQCWIQFPTSQLDENFIPTAAKIEQLLT